MSSVERTDFSARFAPGATDVPARSPINWWAFAPVADAAVLTLAVFVERVSGRAVGASPLPLTWFLLFPPITIALLAAARLYRSRLRIQLLDDLGAIAGATAIAAMTTISASVVLGGHTDLAVQGVRLWLFSTVYLTASRGGVISSLLAARRSGDIGARTLIVGAGSVGRLLAKRLNEHPEVGLRPVGFLDKEPLGRDDVDSESPSLPVLGASWDLGEVLERERIGHVVFTFSTAPHDVMLRMIDECTRREIRVTLVPRLFEKMPRDLTIEHLGGMPLISINPSIPSSWRFRFKYLLDRVVAGLVFTLLSPLLLILALAVRVSLGRPIFFRQSRVGRDGRCFEMVKFRTMRAGDPQASKTDTTISVKLAPGGVEGQDRRTRLGVFLRRTSLDELPQLLNVIRGEMSLVGPRPERPEFVDLFVEQIYRYNDRHRVKSGITGWAQVNGLRGKTSLTDRVEWDNWYIENWSPWLDLKILLATLVTVIRNAKVVE
jgi:exopolysaccharide biosynthesis polyprenyl glycosylphosphotransferase